MGIGSFNMVYVLNTQFGIFQTLPFVVSYWVYTVTGLGVYMTYRYLTTRGESPVRRNPVPALESRPETLADSDFSFMVDGERVTLACRDIHYLESLENYVRIFTATRNYVTRLTLKEAEARLPREGFLRISRSHILNRALAEPTGPETLKLGSKEFRIGRVYKRHVAEHLKPDF
ncbi:LytR/AlgR family response regulator transcription factor [Tellurirhabdus rosea]|uniref:LytR/AlgR family response regulator transcription factor n=1 Tax=Tellurirhabdus rosea TaxID=2674997 RepID=UPI0022549EFE|nr:LytTR family DNA-binding domain-containing protein [Tellurirhabdus rosea]